MSQFNVDSTSNFHLPSGLKRDPVRREPLVRIRVKVKPICTNIPRAQINGVDSNTVKHGTHEVLIYTSDLKRVQALVETDLVGLARAHETFRRKQLAFMQGHFRGEVPDESLWDSKLYNGSESFASLAYKYTESNPEAEFREMTGRGILPLEFCEVLEELPAPVTLEEAANAASIETMAAAIAKANSGNMDQLLALATKLLAAKSTTATK